MEHVFVEKSLVVQCPVDGVLAAEGLSGEARPDDAEGGGTDRRRPEEHGRHRIRREARTALHTGTGEALDTGTGEALDTGTGEALHTGEALRTGTSHVVVSVWWCVSDQYHAPGQC